MKHGTWTRRELLTAIGAAALTPTACTEVREDDPEPAVFPGPILEPGDKLPWRNWAGSQACLPDRRLTPKSEAELAEELGRTRGPVRPVGAGHSFSPLVPTEGTIVSLDLLSGLIDTDEDAQTGLMEAEFWAGTRLFELGPVLYSRGQSMQNLPDIDQQALAGAVATSTHGTGVNLGSLSETVTAVTLVGADGRVRRCSRDQESELFDAARTSLGALGVVTRLRLRTRPAHRLLMHQYLQPTEEVLEDLERLKQHEHFEFFAIPHSSYSLVVTADETDAPDPVVVTKDVSGDEDAEEGSDASALEQLADLYEAVAWIPGIGKPLYNTLIGLGYEPHERIGPAYEVLSNLRLTRFNEMEYTVPAEAGPQCLREILKAMEELPKSSVWPLEYRYVRADDIWLSPFYERDGCTISLHQPINRDYRPFFDAVEPIFWKYGGRPHWGKLHSLDGDRLAHLYPRWSDFDEVRREIDPEGRFLNDHLRRVFDISV